MANNHILLESGTNEVEVLEFQLGDDYYGINVLKVREVIGGLDKSGITPIPNAHPCMEGIFHIRNEVVPIIDLAKCLHYPGSQHPDKDKYIISEMNGTKVAFHVHNVTRIHSTTWEKIEKPSELMQSGEQATVAIVRLPERMILLLDFEKIIGDMLPNAFEHQLKSLGVRERSEKRIMVVEDSLMLSRLLEQTLSEAGYSQIRLFGDGKLAWEALEKYAQTEQIENNVHLVITDIEMPQMDGFHLTRRIKEHAVLKQLPVVIFSSLITDSLRHKGERIGADAQINKPDILQLIGVVDRLVR
ncbi:chemotaxis protein [Paenibacillus aestuarii]|uniref:Chemotaxis protein n=1 Tax=Paenibacillus aestuarii TaxID=516965 RepID=A0ABW0K1M3_9BACL|nr:chemotaxis protein [Paenibacillus aestuarii]